MRQRPACFACMLLVGISSLIPFDTSDQIMNCCCCCQWCAGLNCCPGLKHENKGSPYPHIRYSPVASPQNAGVADGPADDEKRLKLLEAHCVSRPESVFAYLKDKSSQFSVHPQMGVSAGTITEQPSVAGSFVQRFSAGMSSEMHNDDSGLDYLPVYREKATVDTNYDTGHGTCSNDPIIQFSLHHDVHQSKLRVRLLRASNLPKEFCKDVDQPVQCDPYVMLHLQPDREDTFQSQIIKGTLNPTFNEDFQFKDFSLDNILQQTLVCQIYNHASKKSIGKVCLPLADVELSGVVMQMKIDTEESNFEGNLLISLSYSPETCVLEAIIIKATGLRRHDLLGKADPYVKVYIIYNDNKVFKWKSSVKRNTLHAVYEEGFSCNFTEEMSMDVENINLLFCIVDYDRILWNDVMGVVDIGRNAGSKLGKKHWTEVIQSPRQRISFWHSIQPATSSHIKRYTRSRSNSPVPPDHD